MMSVKPPTALELALALLKVRRLFISLFLGPVLVGVMIVAIQTVTTLTFIEVLNEGSSEYGERITQSVETSILGNFIFGTSEIPVRPVLCLEGDHKENCKVRSYDIVVHNSSGQSLNTADFSDAFSGAAERIHFCNECSSDFVLSVEQEGINTTVSSLSGMAVIFLSNNQQLLTLKKHLKTAREGREKTEKVMGKIQFQPPGLNDPIAFSDASNIFAIVLNVCLTIGILLWLAIRAHRRILDYFAKNDVLLPLVAGCGKKTVYHALMLLTFARVLVFALSACIPIILVLNTASGFSPQTSIGGPRYMLMLWMLAVLLSLGTFG